MKIGTKGSTPTPIGCFCTTPAPPAREGRVSRETLPTAHGFVPRNAGSAPITRVATHTADLAGGCRSLASRSSGWEAPSQRWDSEPAPSASHSQLPVRTPRTAISRLPLVGPGTCTESRAILAKTNASNNGIVLLSSSRPEDLHGGGVGQARAGPEVHRRTPQEGQLRRRQATLPDSSMHPAA